MTLGGWVVMCIAVGGMTGLLGWCIYRVVATPESTKHLHTQADIITPDTQDE